MRTKTVPLRVLLLLVGAALFLTSCEDHHAPSEPSFGAHPVALTPRDSAAQQGLIPWPWDPGPTPGAITNYSVWYTTDHSARVVFNNVDDGTGQPAKVQFRYYMTGAWETGNVATDVQCTTLPGSGGQQQSCDVNGMPARQSWSVQAAAYRVNMLVDTVWGAPSDALFAHTAPVGGANVVTTLSSPGSGADYIDLSFRAVADSAGSTTPARYRLRMMPTPLNWGDATQVTTGTCSGDPPPPLVVDSVYVCRITGLAPGTSYQFQLYTRRVRPGEIDVYGDLSNIATGATTP
jgi:hypothetical protein